jgi:uncharacterized membrane protein
VTSVIGIYLGIQAFNGWLAILYGLLGASMGVAGIAAVLTKHPLRDALLGWFLIGITSRAILESLYFIWIGWFISFVIVVVLLAGLVYELSRHPSAAGTLYALGGGAAAILSLVVLVYVSPYLPALCPAALAEGKSVILIPYPPSAFPWDEAELANSLRCL